MFLLGRAHALEEQPCLGEVVGKRRAALAHLVRFDAFRVRLEATIAGCWRGLLGPTAVDRVGFIGSAALVHGGPVQCITLTVVVGRQRAVDRYLVEVRPAEPADLGIGVGKQTALQQRVVGKINAGNDMPGAEGNLFGFGKEIVRVAVEHHLAQRRNRHQLFGDDLGRVEQVEVERVLVFFSNDLHAELPFRVIAGFDRFPEVAAVVVGIFTRQLLRFVPEQRTYTSLGLPMEFDEA
ncbi:hypothetical protein D9M71_427870 [compost metagenome]